METLTEKLYINASQLAFLLKIKKDDADSIMQHCYYKLGNRLKPGEDFPQAIDVEIIERVKHIDLTNAMIDIRDNYLKRAATRKWILEYPVKKYVPSKASGLFPEKITIPNPLKSLLSEEVINEVVEKWKELYPDFRVRFY